MSTNIYWEPESRKKKRVGDLSFKKILRERFGYPVNWMLDKGYREWLTGLKDADVKGALELLEAINKFGSIRVIEED